MAGRKNAFLFFASTGRGADKENFLGDEFDESDMWGLPVEPEFRKPVPASRLSANRKSIQAEKKGDLDRGRVTAGSLPVNIPDWSKILKDQYRGNRGSYGSRLDDVDEDEDGEVTGGAVIPPHEYLCRNRAASFSVHEGLGRTLKGRDLSRVRNAILEKTGFQD